MPGNHTEFSRYQFIHHILPVSIMAFGLNACRINPNSPAFDLDPTDPESPLNIDPDRLAYAAALLAIPEGTPLESFSYPQLSEQGYIPIKSNLNGKQVVYYNTNSDRFLKRDLRTQVTKDTGGTGTAILKEYYGQRASVQTALNITEDQLDDYVRLVKITTSNGADELIGVESRYLGINVARALQKGILKPEDIPMIAEQLYSHAETLYQNPKFGLYNRDLNATNVLINTESGQVKTIIIDWANSGKGASTGIRTTAMRKFFSSILGENTTARQLIIQQSFEQTESIEFRQILIEIAKRKKWSTVAWKTAKGSIPLVLAVVGAALMVKDAKASYEDAAQQGDNFHMDLAVQPLIEAGLPANIVNQTIDEMHSFPQSNGFYALPFIPLAGNAFDKIYPLTVSGNNKALVINNYLDDRASWLPSPIFTGLSIGQSDGQLVFTRLETNEHILDGDILNLVMQGRDENGKPGLEIWECVFRINYQHPGIDNIYPYVIIPQRLALFAPEK